MYVDPTGHFVLSAWMVGALVGFGVSFASSLVSQALTGESLADGKVWAIAAIDGAFGALSGALGGASFKILNNPFVSGAIDAGITFVNSLGTTGISNDWQFDSGDWTSITISSVASGFLSWISTFKKRGISNTNAFDNAENAIDKAKELIHKRKIGQKVKTKNINYYSRKANKLVWEAYGTFNAYLSYMSIFTQSLGGNALADLL